MSISQLDDPSMREALGLEANVPTALNNPTVIGSGNGSIQIGCGPAATQNGQLFLNEINANGTLGVGQLVINDPADINYRNLYLTPTNIDFQQANTGTSFPLAQFTDATGDIAVTATTIDVGAITNLTTINGAPYPPTIPLNYAVSSALVGPLGPYPVQLFRAVIPHNIPNGQTALLTVALNGLVLPNPLGVGLDTLGISVREQTGNVPTPATLFTMYPPTIRPDLAAQGPISLIAQTIITSDGGTEWTVAVNVLASTSGTNYTVSGGGTGMATLTQLS